MTELEKVKNEIQGLRKSKQFSLLSLLLERLEGLQHAAKKRLVELLTKMLPTAAGKEARYGVSKMRGISGRLKPENPKELAKARAYLAAGGRSTK